MCTKNCCQIVHKVCVLILKTTDKIFIVKGKKKKKKDLNRHLMKEDIQMAHKLVKWFSTPFVTRVLQIKKWWDTTSHLLQGLRIQKINNTGKVAEKLSSIADGKTKWYNL